VFVSDRSEGHDFDLTSRMSDEPRSSTIMIRTTGSGEGDILSLSVSESEVLSASSSIHWVMVVTKKSLTQNLTPVNILDHLIY